MLIGITYDLNKLGQRYAALDAALQRNGGRRIVETFWVFRNTTVAAVHTAAKSHFDDNDRWMVFEMGSRSGWLEQAHWDFMNGA